MRWSRGLSAQHALIRARALLTMTGGLRRPSILSLIFLAAFVATIAISILSADAQGTISTSGDALEAARAKLIPHTLADGPTAQTLLWNAFKTVLVGIGIALLLRTSAIMQRARFIRQLAIAQIFIACGVLADIITTLFIDRISVNALAANQLDVLTSTLDVIKKAQRTSDGIAVTISFFSTFWLVLAWGLISRYPREGLRANFVVTAMAVLGVAVAAVAAITAAFQEVASTLLEIADAATSAIAVGLVGWGLFKIQTDKNRHLLRLALLLCYLVWAVGELAFLGLQQHFAFNVVLFIVGYATVILTVIFCSLTMEVKDEFATTDE